MSKTRTQLRFSIRRLLKDANLFYTPQHGTVTAALAGTAVTGTSTLFLTEYEVGAEIKIDAEIRTIADIASNTALTLQRAVGSAHTGSAHALVTERVWAEDEIDDALDEASRQLFSVLWDKARAALDGIAYADLATGANSDLVTIPTTLASFNMVEALPTASARYRPLRQIATTEKDRLRDWYWYLPGSSTPMKPIGIPSAYTVVSATKIELNAFPAEAITSGLRFYGPLKVVLGTADTDTLLLPDADYAAWDQILAAWAASKLVLTDEVLPVQRSEAFQARGDNLLGPLIDSWAIGRSTGEPSYVRCTE